MKTSPAGYPIYPAATLASLTKPEPGDKERWAERPLILRPCTTGNRSAGSAERRLTSNLARMSIVDCRHLPAEEQPPEPPMSQENIERAASYATMPAPDPADGMAWQDSPRYFARDTAEMRAAVQRTEQEHRERVKANREATEAAWRAERLAEINREYATC